MNADTNLWLKKALLGDCSQKESASALGLTAVQLSNAVNKYLAKLDRKVFYRFQKKLKYQNGPIPIKVCRQHLDLFPKKPTVTKLSPKTEVEYVEDFSFNQVDFLISEGVHTIEEIEKIIDKLSYRICNPTRSVQCGFVIGAQKARGILTVYERACRNVQVRSVRGILMDFEDRALFKALLADEISVGDAKLKLKVTSSQFKQMLNDFCEAENYPAYKGLIQQLNVQGKLPVSSLMEHSDSFWGNFRTVRKVTNKTSVEKIPGLSKQLTNALRAEGIKTLFDLKRSQLVMSKIKNPKASALPGVGLESLRKLAFVILHYS